VRFALPRRAAYAKFAQAASGYAMAGVMVAQLDAGIRVAVTGAGPGVFRWREAEAALAGKWSSDAIAGCALDAGALNTDLHGSAAYRAQLVRVMAAQAIDRLS